MVTTSLPTLDVDLFTEEAILEPYGIYREIRDAGPVVWLARHQVYALGRHADVRKALRDDAHFVSGQGVFYNTAANTHSRGTVLASDGKLHDRLRGVVAQPLLPKAVRTLAEGIEAEAETLVQRLVASGTFDAVTDLAWHLPSTIVTRLVGLPEEGRERMREWGIAAFNAGGPDENPRSVSALADFREMYAYTSDQSLPARLLPESWSTRIFAAAQAGEIEAHQCVSLLIDYVAPSLDTTVSGLSSAIYLFAQHPDQWDALRETPMLIPRAIAEILRLETPIRSFTRAAAGSVEIDGNSIADGSRVAMLYASANRDPRKWNDPEKFNIRRENLTDHLAFGQGVHICAGMHLAQLEITAVLQALLKRVKHFELGTPQRLLSNLLRGFRSLPVRVIPR